MNIFRAHPLVKLTSCSLKNLLKNNNSQFKQPVRGKTFYQYRNEEPPLEYLNAIRPLYEGIGAFIWWFVIWRGVAEYEIILGPKIPKMTDWTDEELGVPPLEEDP